MRNVLVTGGAGFIGSNFIDYALRETDWNLINLDALTYAGNLENLSEAQHSNRHRFIKGDIRDESLLSKIFTENEVDAVVNFAAESHVDRSIENPQIFLDVNIKGTQTLLDAALRAWKLDPADRRCRKYREGVRFLQVSTDEVYGTLSSDDPRFEESNPLRPNSPYSASKASADMFVRAYGETYGLPVNITRCSNNYGPRQFPEKLIPLMINNAKNDNRLPVYGDGKQIRDWLYVEDHCSAIVAVLDKGSIGEIYNVGGNNEKANIDIVRLVLKELGKPESLIDHVEDRLGHDRRYAINNAKITGELGWKPSCTFEEGIEKTVWWYKDNRAWMDRVIDGSYQQYYQRMYC